MKFQTSLEKGWSFLLAIDFGLFVRYGAMGD